MKRFVNRKRELGRLNRRLESDAGSLVVVWGRRRIGKTRLLVEWVRNRGCYTVADQSAAPVQRTYLAQALDESLPGFADVEYPDWRSFFSRVSREARARQWRGPVVVDEFPYLVAVSPELPSLLQHWIDHECKPLGLVVALAGSSQRMMQGIVLDASAPLYGRASELLHLAPLQAGYIQQAFPRFSPVEAVEFFAAWGGIPYYWELAADHGGDLPSTVDALVLDPLGPLHREPDKLLLEETPSAVSLRPLLDAVGLGAHKVSEIAGRLGQNAGSLSRPLAHLQEMELLIRDVPFGENPKASKRSLYRIADPFFRLWFRTVAPQRGLLAYAPRNVRLAQWQKHRPQLTAQAWEELCRTAVPSGVMAPAAGEAAGPWGVASRYWWGNEPEWDVVAQSLDGTAILLGECKWWLRKPQSTDLAQLADEVLRRPIPHRAAGAARIVRVAFVPELPTRTYRKPGVVFVTAEQVLCSLATS